MESSPGSDASLSTRSEHQRREYVCDICDTRLSRPAHLQRHLKRHSEVAVKTFHCQLCGRSFSRKDVYQRHKRSVHGPDQATRRNSRKKSCQRCIRYKLRCSREVPCTACRKSPDQCVYSTGSVAPTVQPIQESFQSNKIRLQEDGRLANLEDLADAANVLQGLSVTSLDVQKTPLVDGDSIPRQSDIEQTLAMAESVMNPEVIAARNECEANVRDFSFTSSPLPSSAGGVLYPDYNLHEVMHEQQETLQAEGEAQQLHHLLGECSEPHDPGELEHNSVVPCVFDLPLDPLHVDLCGWDTLLGGETEPDGLSSGVSVGDTPRDRTELSHTSVGPEFSGDSNSQKEVTSEMDSTAVQANRHETRHRHGITSKDGENKRNWPGVLDQGGNETWPFDYPSNKGFRKIKLPPLKQVLEQTVASRPIIQKDILSDLIKVLSAPQIPSLNDAPALEVMPAVAFLGEFTRVFFAEFHNVYPVIHKPTWRIEKCATHLSAAMACLGASYSNAEGSSEVSALFAEITQRALFWMGQQDSSAFRNKEYITASYFHQIYALGTGNRRLYEIADASRGLLVTNLRGLGILSSESSVSSIPDCLVLDSGMLKAMSDAELDQAWRAWRDKETAKRMSWSIFEFDCTLSTMTSKRAAFRIAELPSRLPCSESIWEAHSARAWAALVSFASSPPAGLLFYPTLREIMSTGIVPHHAPAWSLRLCAVAIGRILHDLKEVQDSSAPGFLGMPSLTEAHYETRQNLLGALSTLEVSLGKPTCTADVVNMNLTHHRSHLICSGDETMDLVISAFRNSGIEAHHPSFRSAEAAKDRLRYIFKTNPMSARRLVFHSAVITVVARDCTINTPCETLSTFMGYAFILAFVRFFPFEEYDAREIQHQVVRLDVIPWMRDQETMKQVDRWIEVGGPASLGAVTNICQSRSFGAVKQGALDALAKLSVWGLAKKFHQTVSKFT